MLIRKIEGAMKPLKRTRLSSQKEFVPTDDGASKEEYLLVISIDADGLFYAPVPAHLCNTAEHLSAGDDGLSGNHSFRKIQYHDNFVTAGSKSKAIEDWKTLIWRVGEYMTNMVREKVIWYRTEMNIQYQRENGGWVKRSDVSFAKTNPVVGMTYQICYRVGDKLLNEKNGYVADLNLRQLQGVVIPYTEERVQFLENISKMLHKAARQLNEFEEVLKEDPLQIDSVMKQGLLLEYRGA